MNELTLLQQDQQELLNLDSKSSLCFRFSD